ncbi:MAG TPA: hypothetical protein VFV41_15820 [Streptosporangiaceae bacterium]|nr:hypothetical protein [Streptosporangiaceae bacterium]
MSAGKPCASCGDPHAGRGPFCADYCRELAEFVRLCRRWFRDPARQADTDYLFVLQVRLAALHAGYLGRAGREAPRKLTAAEKAAVRERDRGRCTQCGRRGHEVDRIDGHSSELANLQLLCTECRRARTREAITQIADPADRAALAELHELLRHRIDAAVPARACDNEQTWGASWRRWPNLPDGAQAYRQQPAALGFTDIIAVIGPPASARQPA